MPNKKTPGSLAHRLTITVPPELARELRKIQEDPDATLNVSGVCAAALTVELARRRPHRARLRELLARLAGDAPSATQLREAGLTAGAAWATARLASRSRSSSATSSGSAWSDGVVDGILDTWSKLQEVDVRE